MGNRILVTGATGRVGGALVKLLMKADFELRIATRKPAKVSEDLKQSVETVLFDYEDMSTFGPALKEVNKLFLTVRPGDNHSDTFAMPVIDEAKKSGVQHIVALTAMGVEQDETFMLRKLEKYIESSGIPFTHLRPNWFMQNFDSGFIHADIRRTSSIHLPASDAKISFIDVRDIAEAGFAVLSSDKHYGKAYTLTGNESLTHYDVAAKISASIDKKVSYVPLSEEHAKEILTKSGTPEELIERWIQFFRKVRSGFCSPITSDIETILGRQPMLFDQYVKDYSEFWK